MNYPQSKYIHFLACKKFSSNIINKDQRLVEENSGKLEEIFECSQREHAGIKKRKNTLDLKDAASRHAMTEKAGVN